MSYILFYVVEGNLQCLLSSETCLKLGYIKLLDHDQLNKISNDDPNNDTHSIDHIINKFPQTFKGIGCFEEEYNLTLKSDSKPIIHAARRVLIAIKSKL